MSIRSFFPVAAPLLAVACESGGSTVQTGAPSGLGGAFASGGTAPQGQAATSGSGGNRVPDPVSGGSGASGAAPPGGGAAADSGGVATASGGQVSTGGNVGGNPTTSAGAGTNGGGGATSGAGAGGNSGEATGGTTSTALCPYAAPEPPNPLPQNYSSGTVTIFNDDGAWTWYTDERVVVDVQGEKLVLSSDANGSQRNGNVDVVVYDLKTNQGTRSVLGDLNPDDHNNGAIVVTGPSEYTALWAGHNQDCNTYWKSFANGQWGAQQRFDWTQGRGCPWTVSGSQRSITYNNVWRMSAENKYYNFVRSIDTSPNLLTSTDGKSWSYAGRLTSTEAVGYVAGYYKYWGNGVDRIDFLATEAHPRDFNNSLYHGYVKGGKVYDSFDKIVDEDLSDGNAKEITEYTQVFKTGTQAGGVTLNYLWNFDVVRYDDGTAAALWKARANGTQGQADPDHRLLYSRLDGTSWKTTYLVKGGKKLYNDEQDYVGGAALDPDDPRIIYVSTTVDPRDDTTNLAKHEIWKGVTCDDGATFTWAPVTMNSSVDNLRPVMPKWDGRSKALLWFRGSYSTAQIYDAEIVGIVTRP